MIRSSKSSRQDLGYYLLQTPYCLKAWIVSYHHLCIQGRYWAVFRFKSSASSDSGTAHFTILYAYTYVTEKYIDPEFVRRVLYEKLCSLAAKDACCCWEGRHVSLNYGTERLRWEGIIGDGLVQPPAEQGHGEQVARAVSHWVSEVPLHIRGLPWHRQHFINEKLQSWYHNFLLTTKITSDGVKEGVYFLSKCCFANKIQQQIFYISLGSCLERQYPREVICLRN